MESFAIEEVFISLENQRTTTSSTQDDSPPMRCPLPANEMPSPPAHPKRAPRAGPASIGGPPWTTSACFWGGAPHPPVTHPGGPSEGGSERVSLWRWTWEEAAAPWPQQGGGGSVRRAAESSPPASFPSSRRGRGARL